MTASPGPRDVDENTPNSARLYDYYLGGAHNFAADRQLGDRIIGEAPLILEGARANRQFLRRAVDHLAREGIDQFLDLGSGIPTAGNVHEIAQRINPEARVVYVDYEPVAVQTAAQMLADNPRATVVEHDLRSPRAVLEDPRTTELLDLSRPVALLLVGVLLFLTDDDHIEDLIPEYLAHLVPGSHLALSHTSADPEVAAPDVRAEIERMQAGYRSATERFHVRGKDEIRSWFAGTELVEPGIVSYVDWRPEREVTAEARHGAFGYVGVGRVP